MDQPVDRLCAALADETALCEALTAVLRDQQAAVVGLRAATIVECVAARERLRQDLLQASGARREAVAALARALGAPATSATDLLPHLPLAARCPLETRLRALRRTLLESRSLERETARLVGTSLDGVGELLRALRAFVPGARYGADAEIATPAAPERVDRRV
jgi:hypothetical protein